MAICAVAGVVTIVAYRQTTARGFIYALVVGAFALAALPGNRLTRPFGASVAVVVAASALQSSLGVFYLPLIPFTAALLLLMRHDRSTIAAAAVGILAGLLAVVVVRAS